MTTHPEARKRGRPPKFGRPGQLVAVTLPAEVVRGLRQLDADLAWAIVSLFERRQRRPNPSAPHPDGNAELAAVSGNQSLIVVNRNLFNRLPGVSIIPLQGERGLLALAPGRNMADLELAVTDRLAVRSVAPAERKALTRFRGQLRAWRRDGRLRPETRSIIILEHLSGAPTRSQRKRRPHGR